MDDPCQLIVAASVDARRLEFTLVHTTHMVRVVPDVKGLNGGTDGIRTRNLSRDRGASCASMLRLRIGLPERIRTCILFRS